MNIQQLRYFNTVAHLENISKAADYLHVSQSALSKNIQRLEEELGTPLFERNGKRISLNKAGMRFYSSSELMLREMQEARDDIDMLVSRKDHRIRIGSAGMPPPMVDCLREFASAHPESIFILNNRIEFEKEIDINEYDALICPDEFRFDKLNGYPLYEESYLFAVNKNDPFAAEKVFSANMLEGRPVVFMQGESQTPEYPYRICSATEAGFGTLLFTDTRDNHRRIISAGLASGFVPQSEASSYEIDRNIKLLKVLDSRYTRPMKICFLREKHLSQLGLLFREHVISFFSLDESGGITE